MPPTPCIVCRSLDTRPCLRTRDYHSGISGQFDLVRCVGCGLVHLDPIPTTDEIADFYSRDYYAYQPVEKPRKFKRLIRRLLGITIKTHDPAFPQPGEFVDIGCGSGDYLHKMSARGWSVRGVEPSAFGAEEGRRSGFDIFNGTLQEAKFATGSFDYVRSNHSFEHVPNPVETLDEIFRILKPDGKLYIGIPNIDGLPYRIFGKYWWHLAVPVHLYSYSVSTISALMQQSGFVIDKVYFNSNFASLLGSLQIYVNRNSEKKSSDGWLIKSRTLMFGATTMTRILDFIGQGDVIEIIARKQKEVVLGQIQKS
jgi:SAM-dependent methyltransferase